MGYTTKFAGYIELDKPMRRRHKEAINAAAISIISLESMSSCPWTVSEDSRSLVLKSSIEDHNYGKWLIHLIKNFLEPWGYVANGCVKWQGEDIDDRGKIYCKNNKVTITYLE